MRSISLYFLGSQVDNIDGKNHNSHGYRQRMAHTLDVAGRLRELDFRLSIAIQCLSDRFGMLAMIHMKHLPIGRTRKSIYIVYH